MRLNLFFAPGGYHDGGHGLRREMGEGRVHRGARHPGGQSFYRDLKRLVAAKGRDPAKVKVLPGTMPVIAETEEVARRLAGELSDLIEFEAGRTRLGAGACDGFNVQAPHVMDGLTAITRRLIPVLQDRGLFRPDHEEMTLRDHLGLDRPPIRSS
jgi:alkanesulfonate monooxygenase SsuD/methylene tetrahydromethanopterin reductase-like flavin-dependent oxidoreductase (luciferase family)